MNAWKCRACSWAWPHEMATHEPDGICLSCGARDVLDHGFITLIETWGSDERIIEAARMSTAKGFLGWGPKCSKCGQLLVRVGVPCGACEQGEAVSGDEKLLAFLWKNNHATPFEMAGAIIEVQAPIFVFREWHRHRTQSYNELSARYTPLPDVNYIPTIDRLMGAALGQAGHPQNKQAGTVADAEVMTTERAEWFQRELRNIHKLAETIYQNALKAGVPKELARVHLPVGRYSRMRASANLRNWLSFLTLRQAPNAQFEIRTYANALHDVLVKKFPRTLALFDEGKK